MFSKFHNLDTNCYCLHVLSSTKTSTIPTGISISQPQNPQTINKSPQKHVRESPNKGVKGFSRVYRKTHHKKPDVFHKPDELTQNPHGEERKNNGFCGGTGKKGSEEVKTSFGDMHTNCSTKCVSEQRTTNGLGRIETSSVVMHAKSSTKWFRYGGCIPQILQALDSINDLDEALQPWADSLSNKERSIILKEQVDWERAFEIFEWFKRKGCYELNVIHYNIMLRILGKARKWVLVKGLWDEMKFRRVAPSNSTYGTLIDAYSKGGLKEEALLWLKRMNEEGMEPDEVTMGIVVQTYKKAGEFHKAEEFFKKWSLTRGNPLTDEGGMKGNGACSGQTCLSSYTYNTLIDTYGKSGQIEEASETFSRMLREGIFPNTVTFNTMIHVCGNHGRMEEVSSLMNKMEELRCPPDTRTYNILISLHAKHDNIKMAANYFTKMKEERLEPDPVSYRTLLYAFSIRHMVREAEALVLEMDKRGLEIDEFTQSALTRMYIEAGLLEMSWAWFMRFHLKGNMSSECYSANIDAYGERGHVLEAEKAFICCQKGRQLSVLEINVMIKAYGISKRYDEACLLFDKMENHGVIPDKCSYNSLIQILASADLPHIAKSYVRKMQEAGLVSDCVPYCAVISSFVKLGQLELAEGLFEEMNGFGVKPDIVVYGVLINAFGDIGSVKEAITYVDAMKNSGLPGNAVIYNSLIKLYTKVGYLKEAQETYEMLQLMDVGPDAYSSNCMIDLYSERSMVKQAEKIFEALKRKGDANEFSYAMMLCMYKRLGRFEEAVGIAQKMRELGLINEMLSYNNVLGLYALDGRFKEAVETFKEMIGSSVELDDSTFRSLGLVLVKCGISKEAVCKLEATRRKDAKSGLKAWVSTLSSVVEFNADDNA